MPRFVLRRTKNREPGLCDICRAIDTHRLEWLGTIWIRHQSSISALEKSARRECPLCKLLYTALTDSNVIIKESRWSSAPAVEIAGYGRDMLQGQPGLQQLRVSCGDNTKYAVLGIYADDDSPAALSKKVAGRVARPANDFRTAKLWLDICRSTHDICRLQTTKNMRPTRLLDLQDHNILRIVAGETSHGEYATLSHCWGSKIIVQLTEASADQFASNIPWDLFSKTFQDAILIARGLNIPYLWIDSLCIIQDNPGDWERESASMARIYAQAAVNIACCASSDGEGGCFQSRLEPNDYVEIKDTENENGTIKIGPFLGFGEAVARSPLLSRGWVVQERLLSRRKLYYAKNQLYWHCSQTYMSECQNQFADLDFQDDVARNFQASIDPNVLWQNLVTDYTACKLTKEDDKLPAISGLAGKFAAATGRQYAAGLWEDDLLNGLLWVVADRSVAKRYTKYIAPSWSWASIEGPVCYPLRFAIKPNDGKYSATSARSYIWLAGTDPHGRVTLGNVTIAALIRQVQYQYCYETDETAREFDLFPQGKLRIKHKGWGNLLLKTYYKTESVPEGTVIGAAYLDEEEPPTGPVYCLLIKPRLVLVLQSDGFTEYRRIGIGWISRSGGEYGFSRFDFFGGKNQSFGVYEAMVEVTVG